MLGFILFFTVDLYLCLSFLGPLYAQNAVLFFIGFAGVNVLMFSQLWLYFIFFKSTAEQKVLFEKPLQKFSFLSMGLISFLFTFTLARDVLGLIPFLIFRPVELYSPLASAIILSLSSLCFIAGALNARFRLLSPRIEIKVPGLLAPLAGLKIVQLSDVHLGTGPNVAQVKAIVERTLSLKPDLIALTGDIIDGMIAEMEPELKELARLKAPHGVFFVPGNHEYYWKHEESIRKLKEFGFTVLINEGVEKEIHGARVFIAGINDPAGAHFGTEKQRIPIPPASSQLKIVLVHQPQIAPKVAEYPYDLQLSGHTHGGQFFPWNLLVRRIYAIHGGLGRIKNLWVYVSQGTGYWGPPIRLGTDGEVTELIFTNPDAKV